MAQLIAIEQLEAIINRVRLLAPPVDGVLSPELRILAEIYGNMIADPTQLLDLELLAEQIRPVALTLLGAPPRDRPRDVRQYGLPF
ncbi:DUF3717 domain-containing protein [Massilia soli]|uniref:DUF3717 domain-containing protein n=1 Tax=Massilia soli TaxID=2792854 RepID=A0ABS7SPF4_9BURK|nr:DUF3717 domain-containing protein [Massilia soli]